MNALPEELQAIRIEVFNYCNNAIPGAMIPLHVLQRSRALIEAQSDEVRRLREALNTMLHHSEMLLDEPYPAWRGRLTKIVQDARAALGSQP